MLGIQRLKYVKFKFYVVFPRQIAICMWPNSSRDAYIDHLLNRQHYLDECNLEYAALKKETYLQLPAAISTKITAWDLITTVRSVLQKDRRRTICTRWYFDRWRQFVDLGWWCWSIFLMSMWYMMINRNSYLKSWQIIELYKNPMICICLIIYYIIWEIKQNK